MARSVFSPVVSPSGSDFSFGPERRIKNRKDYLRIQQGGRKLRSAHFLLAYSIIKDEPKQSRIGVTITTKVNKLAVERNRLRRRIRELFRSHQQFLAQPLDLVVIALNGATDLSFNEVREELFSALKRGRLCEKCSGEKCNDEKSPNKPRSKRK